MPASPPSHGLSSVSFQARFFVQNRHWFLSAEPAAGNFVRYAYPAARDGRVPGWTPSSARSADCLSLSFRFLGAAHGAG